MKKRILSMLLVVALAASLAGCSKENDTPNTPDNTEEGQSEGGDGEKESSNEGIGEKIEKFEPGITVTTVRPFSDATQNYGEGEDIENNAWTKLFENKYGIDLTYKWITTDAEYTSKLNLDITSGELVDYFRVDKKQLSELVDADMIQPLDDVWEMYASDKTKELIETEGGEKVMEACMYDGKMMAIPFTGNPKESAQIMYIRKDWLENLKLEMPKTMDDVLAIAEAFASQDPDGNGEDDTYAVVMDQLIFTSIYPLFYANNSFPGTLVVNENGELTTGFVDENTKEVLALLNKWYETGDIDPEWFTKDAAKSYETLVNGKVGLYFSSFSAPLYPLQAQHDLEPDSDWISMPVPGYDGKPITNAYSLGVTGYYVASKDFEHPEAMIMMLNDWVELFYYNTDDALQLQYINAENGAEIWLNAPIMAYRGFKNMQCSLDITEYYAGNMAMEELTAEERGYITSIEAFRAGDQSMWAWEKIFGPDGSASKIQPYIENDAYIFNEHWGNPTATELTSGSVLTDYQQQSFTSFINGERPLDEWDNFVSEYRSMGYDQVLQELGEQYQLGN